MSEEQTEKNPFGTGFKEVKTPEETIVANLTPNTIYTGDYPNGSGKFVSVNFDQNWGVDVSKQIRLQIRLGYIDEKKKLKGLKISKWKCTKSKCELQESVNFSTFDFDALKNFLSLVSEIDLGGAVSGKILLDTNDLIGSTQLKRKLKTLMISKDGQEFLKEIFLTSPELSTEDFVNVNYRKQQLKKFKEMLGGQHSEPEWQKFFEDNPWIFGYGLQYFWGHKVANKMQATAVGSTHNKPGKNPDGLLMTAAHIKRSVFVEIKTPDTPLINNNPGKEFRAGCWSPSVELTGAIAQVQKTARLYCEENILKERVTEQNGDFKFDLYNIAPKCIVVTGALNEFSKDGVINEEKYSSFEIYRSSISNPEVITFDELYERARHIVEVDQKDKSSEEVTEDLPF